MLQVICSSFMIDDSSSDDIKILDDSESLSNGSGTLSTLGSLPSWDLCSFWGKFS